MYKRGRGELSSDGYIEHPMKFNKLHSTAPCEQTCIIV